MKVIEDFQTTALSIDYELVPFSSNLEDRKMA